MHSLPSCLDDWVVQQGDAMLFAFHDGAGRETERYDYAGFADRTKRLAAMLRRRGLGEGQRAMLLHPPGLELLVALIACMRVGAIPVVAPISSPRGWRSPTARSRIAAIVADCSPAIGLALASQADEMLRERLAGGGVAILATDGPTEPAPVDWRDTPDTTALLQYTSGSTSEPKGVVVTHDTIVANARALLDHAPIGGSWLPQFHDMGLIGFGLFPIVMGGRSHGLTPVDFLRRPAIWLKLLSEQRATFAAAPNFAYDRLLALDAITAAEIAELDLSALRVMINGAEPVQPETCRRFRERFAGCGLRGDALVAAYGLAEATLAVTRGGCGARSFDARRLAQGTAVPGEPGAPMVELASCGPVLPNLDIAIGAPARSRGEGVVGEIHVRGPSITPGYWRRPPRADGWLATGDLGFLLEGELHVTGRSRELIIQGGVNFHPHDIEALIDARTVALQDDDGLTWLLCEPVPGAPTDLAALAERIGSECGVRIDRVVELPARGIRWTTSGKRARRKTLQAVRDGTLRPLREYRAEAGEDGGSALDWIRRGIARDGAMADAPLAQAGLDSLGLVRLQLEFEALAAGEEYDFDGPLLQQSRCGALIDLADALVAGDTARARVTADSIIADAASGRVAEREQMIRDAAQPIARPTPRSGLATRGEAVFLTGATGFLGPFLLVELLEQSPLPVTVLVRAADPVAGRARIEAALVRAGLARRAAAAGIAERLTVWPGDLAQPMLGLDADRLQRFEATGYEIVHNGAMVDYVRVYATLRPANIDGTRTLLDMAARGAAKRFHHVSSTFIFGWTRDGVLREADCNAGMEALDFGYSQTKWVAEALVRRAGAQGLPVAIYRPALISVAAGLQGDSHDVAARLLAFIIRHGVAVDSPNQISLLPVDVIARNLIAIAQRPIGAPVQFHLTADRYYSLTELVRQIERDYGFALTYLPIPQFVARLNALADADDPVFPLLDFFNRSAPHIAAMSLKRYDSSGYRSARAIIPGTLPDPSLAVVAGRMVRFLDGQGWLPDVPGIALRAMTSR